MGAAKELFHILRIAAGVFFVVFLFVIKLNGTDRAESAFVAKDKVDGLVFDKAISLVTTLGANFVAEERIKADARDNIEFLAEEVV